MPCPAFIVRSLDLSVIILTRSISSCGLLQEAVCFWFSRSRSDDLLLVVAFSLPLSVSFILPFPSLCLFCQLSCYLSFSGHELVDEVVDELVTVRFPLSPSILVLIPSSPPSPLHSSTFKRQILFL